MATDAEIRAAIRRTARRLAWAAARLEERSHLKVGAYSVENDAILAIRAASDLLGLIRSDACRASFGLPEPVVEPIGGPESN